MKKFYALVLAVATIASASAVERTTNVAKFNLLPAKAATSVLSTTPMLKAPAGFTSIDEVAGEYTWSYYGLLEGNSGSQSGIVTITLSDALTNEVIIDGIVSEGTGIAGKIKGTVDLEAGTLTIPNKQYLGPDSYGDTNYFYFKELDEEYNILDGASDAESVAATIDGKSFVFPDEYLFAVGDYDDEDLGWWMLTAFNSFEEYSEPDDLIDLEEWESFSTATMIDGWIMPVITYNDGTYVDPADFPLEVQVLKNKTNPNLYAIANPYVAATGFPLSGGEEGYIVLDMTDPDFVLVNPGVYCGFSNGTNRLYCLNIEAFYVEKGYSKEIITAALADEISEWSNYKEEANTTIVSIPNCCFNYPTALDTYYQWTDRSDAMKATITINNTLTGIEVISIENATAAPVEYFNLQGVRVANPENGLYIRRQGNTATKVLVK